MDVDRLIQVPTANRLYNAACAMAILARTDPRHEVRAVDLLRRAIETGFSKATAKDDDDLRILRTRPEFRHLVGD